MKKYLILASVLLMCGCASIFQGTSENIIIRSEEKGTKIYINDEYIGTDSGVATISKKKLKNSYIRASKKGCKDTIRHIDTSIDATSFLGCFLDACIITVGIIDWGTTGAIRYAPQTNFFVTPVCKE